MIWIHSKKEQQRKSKQTAQNKAPTQQLRHDENFDLMILTSLRILTDGRGSKDFQLPPRVSWIQAQFGSQQINFIGDTIVNELT
jgi:hypothetical protein